MSFIRDRERQEIKQRKEKGRKQREAEKGKENTNLTERGRDKVGETYSFITSISLRLLGEDMASAQKDENTKKQKEEEEEEED